MDEEETLLVEARGSQEEDRQAYLGSQAGGNPAEGPLAFREERQAYQAYQAYSAYREVVSRTASVEPSLEVQHQP